MMMMMRMMSVCACLLPCLCAAIPQQKERKTRQKKNNKQKKTQQQNKTQSLLDCLYGLLAFWIFRKQSKNFSSQKSEKEGLFSLIIINNYLVRSTKDFLLLLFSPIQVLQVCVLNRYYIYIIPSFTTYQGQALTKCLFPYRQSMVYILGNSLGPCLQARTMGL